MAVIGAVVTVAAWLLLGMLAAYLYGARKGWWGRER